MVPRWAGLNPMNRIAPAGLWFAAALALVVGYLGMRSAATIAPSDASSAAGSIPKVLDLRQFGESLRVVADRDPFRVERRPFRRAYDPVEAQNPVPFAELVQPARPALFVSGIAWGQSPSALLEGVPGADGPRLIRSGDTLGGLNVRRITAAQVTIGGYDTVWNLSLRQPW